MQMHAAGAIYLRMWNCSNKKSVPLSWLQSLITSLSCWNKLHWFETNAIKTEPPRYSQCMSSHVCLMPDLMIGEESEAGQKKGSYLCCYHAPDVEWGEHLLAFLFLAALSLPNWCWLIKWAAERAGGGPYQPRDVTSMLLGSLMNQQRRPMCCAKRACER